MKRTSAVCLLAASICTAGCAAEEPKILAVSPLADTRDNHGPYSVTVVASGISDGDEVEVLYRLTGGENREYVGVVAQEGERSDLFVASLPGQPAGTTVEYYAVAKRDGLAVTLPPEMPLSFKVLALSGFCRADSDCQLGLEICTDPPAGTCRAYEGSCVVTPMGFACPGGYSCDTSHDPDVCVILPRACANDSQCPTVEECDRDRDLCVARFPCEAETDCPDAYLCQTDIGLCFVE